MDNNARSAHMKTLINACFHCIFKENTTQPNKYTRSETSMEKNRIRPITNGKSSRMSYSRQKEVLQMPNLIEVQKDSYQWFLDEGLKEVFRDISPIADYSGHLSLEFVDFTLCEDDVKYTIEECKERDATYAAPLKVRVRLYNKEKDEINEHEIFMGDLPLMTATGTFVINGAERVIVSQLVRSPGIYYAIAHDKIGKELFSSTVIPNRGAWLEYETDSNDVFYVRVDRTRKVPITVLIRALGFGTNAEIIELFGEEPKILASFGKDTAENYQEGLLELYKKIRPGEPLAVDSAESLITSMFFDARRYDLAKVGRYKFNKKLALKNLGRTQLADEFYKRSQNYRNVFNPASSFMQPIDDKGVFQPNFSPDDYTAHICESNGWQYFWSVQQDIKGLIALTGGKDRFTEKLDSMFTYIPAGNADLPLFSTGMIGQYAHGNEPSHHVIYLYNKVRQPWKTQKYAAQVMHDLYFNAPAGLCGNEDCGQMSAWYVFSAMGFYPVNPVSGEYEIGTPLFPEIQMHLDNGKTFTVLAPGVSRENIYIQSVKVNGQPYDKSYITHRQIMDGATVEFEMGPEPGNIWYR